MWTGPGLLMYSFGELRDNISDNDAFLASKLLWSGPLERGHMIGLPAVNYRLPMPLKLLIHFYTVCRSDLFNMSHHFFHVFIQVEVSHHHMGCLSGC